MKTLTLPRSPFDVAKPATRWTPDVTPIGVKQIPLPPLVANLRVALDAWRSTDYPGASETTRALLHHWFLDNRGEHWIPQVNGSMRSFQYYFAQREAVETVMYLVEIEKIGRANDLIKFDETGELNLNRLSEAWPRVVTKMATGSGKTKVISLLMAWSYFHKRYELDSPLSDNFLLVAPNVIVFDRLKSDFESGKIFFKDPILPEDGFQDRDWKADFQLRVHLQDEIRPHNSTGNLFLTNIHRLYNNDTLEPILKDDEDADNTDYFFGAKVIKSARSGPGVREAVRSLAHVTLFNDEAHHIHDEKLTWSEVIKDLYTHFEKKEGKGLCLQVDVSATPKNSTGAMFPHVVSDYPLVEAIWQDVVKHPVLPDEGSREKLVEGLSTEAVEAYADHLRLGVEEWRKSEAEQIGMGRHALLFVMVEDTRQCDNVAAWLEDANEDLRGRVLVIHTKNNGEISGSDGKKADSGKPPEELIKLRKAAAEVDSPASKYRAIVSVMMLREGWDVQNVTTIVGLRSYTSKAEILPEQALGRGLRRMYGGQKDVVEKVSVIGTKAFMEFIQRIQLEGVSLEEGKMGPGRPTHSAITICVDKSKSIEVLKELDIELPIFGAHYERRHDPFEGVDFSNLPIENPKLPLLDTNAGDRDIRFERMLDGGDSHVTVISAGTGSFDAAINFITLSLIRQLRLSKTPYAARLFPLVQSAAIHQLFGQTIDPDDPAILVALRDSSPKLERAFHDAIQPSMHKPREQNSAPTHYIKLSEMPAFSHSPVVGYEHPIKSIQNRIIEENGTTLEPDFAHWLDSCSDVRSFGKNYRSVGFYLDYLNEEGKASTYYPDFFVSMVNNEVWIIETKGLVDVNVQPKLSRLIAYCKQASEATNVAFRCGLVREELFRSRDYKSFGNLIDAVNTKDKATSF